MSEINIPKRHDYNAITPFRLFVKSNFPFIENTYESLDNYGLYCKVVEYLNSVIGEQNKVSEDMVTFTDFVTNYFESLDVQEEINNKLDEMAKSGELQELLKEQYDELKLEINEEITAQNSKISTIQNEITSISSGSPARVFNTLNELQQQNPDHSKIYLVAQDGKWYFWNNITSQWTSGGVYQASIPSDELLKYGSYIPKFIKNIVHGKIEIIKNQEVISIKITPIGHDWSGLMTDNKFYQVQGIKEATFNISEYNVNTGIWCIIANKDNENLFNLKNILSNPLDLAYNDMIVATISSGGQDIITDSLNDIYYNNENINLINKIRPEFVKLISVNVSVYIEKTEEKLIIKTVGSGALYSNRKYIYLNNNINQEFDNSEYNINNDTWAIILNNDSTISVIKFDKQDMHYNSIYDSLIIGFIYSNGNRFYTETEGNIYFNNENYDKIGIIKNEINEINEKIRQLNINMEYDFLRCFKNFTGIGDSLMAGYTNVGDVTIGGAIATQEKNTWIDYLCNRLNRNLNNLARSGSTIENWRYGNQAGVPETNIENANIETDCYIIGLGVNDLRQNKTVGSVSDIKSDYNLNENTVYGNLDYIINKLKNFNPYAKIFIFTIPNSENNPVNINNAIKYVANLYENVHCIDLYNLYNYNEGFIEQNFHLGHYNPITYNYMSKLIEKFINNYIYENYTDFKLIPYDYN